MTDQGKTRVAVAISGGGRSLHNLLKHQSERSYQIAAIISSSESAGGVGMAKDWQLPLCCPDFTAESINNILTDFLHQNRVEWIALAGFLKPFPILTPWIDRTINIHPALLPKFGGKGMYGMHVHRAVKESGDHQSGATIHFVNSEYDKGQVIAQAIVNLNETDSPDSIAKKVFAAECDLYPKVLHQLVTDQSQKQSSILRYQFQENHH